MRSTLLDSGKSFGLIPHISQIFRFSFHTYVMRCFGMDIVNPHNDLFVIPNFIEHIIGVTVRMGKMVIMETNIIASFEKFKCIIQGIFHSILNLYLRSLLSLVRNHNIFVVGVTDVQKAFDNINNFGSRSI